MRARIGTWDGEAAVRLPARLLAEAGLRAGDAVELRAEAGRIVIFPAPDRDALIAAIRPETLPDETDFGAPRGREVW